MYASEMDDEPTIGSKADRVASRDDFIAFVRDLVKDLQDHPENWENGTLDRYLDTVAAWTEDMEGVFENIGKPVPSPSWNLFAAILMAATMYE